MLINDIPEVKGLLSHIVKFLEVDSIICYGSYASGLADHRSDIDLLIIVKKLPKRAQLKKLYNNIPDVKRVELKNLCHWDTTWTLLNTSLKVNEIKFDLGFNTTSWVNKVVKKLIEKNEISFKEFQFRPYTFLGLLESSKCLYDKGKYVNKLKTKIRPFPIGLKRKIVQEFLPLLKDCQEDLLDNAERNVGILAYQYHVFIGLDAICQLLWIINDVYDPSSKRTEAYLFKLKKLPKGFADFINKKLTKSYENKREFIKSFVKVSNYIEKQLNRLGLNPDS